MLAKRIIPCLDVKNEKVIKGIQFDKHKIVGDIMFFAKKYMDEGADELVFYDITASSEKRLVDRKWINKISNILNIPFSVAGGIKNIEDAKIILESGADKISINSMAIEKPYLIRQLSNLFGSQCVVVSIDSFFNIQKKCYQIYQFTGNKKTIRKTLWNTIDWIKYVQKLGAGEIVLNSMNQDGMLHGYDICQINLIRKFCNIPLIVSGGAGSINDFLDVFIKTDADGALAASVFHNNLIKINVLKQFLHINNIRVRLC